LVSDFDAISVDPSIFFAVVSRESRLMASDALMLRMGSDRPHKLFD
jgi:hypothetical protein